MEDGSASTPQSASEQPTTKPSATKDRACPFCHQAFTSSSLGRHLDLYIKEKNPKPPDGLHDVDRIRQMRGSITRRQSRVANLRRTMSASSPSATPSKMEDGVSRAAASPNAGDRLTESMGAAINRPSWTVTGVMNDLPPRAPVKIVPAEQGAEASRHLQLKAGLDQRQKLAQELDNGKAAALALREVVSSLREASSRLTGRPLFDFNPFTLNFPALCLHILPPPTTLFSPSPFSTDDSWPVTLPGEQQYAAIHRAVQERMQAANRQNAVNPLPPDYEYQRLTTHIDDSFRHWQNLPESRQQEVWVLEILRLYAGAKDAHKQAQDTITALRSEIAQLQKRLEESHGAWNGAADGHVLAPSAYSQISPLRLSNELVTELVKQDLDIQYSSIDRLMDKWRTVVRDERNASNGLGRQRPLPAPLHHNRQPSDNPSLPAPSTQTSRNGSTASAMSITRPQHSSAEPGSHADGDGDDDADADADADVEDAPEQVVPRQEYRRLRPAVPPQMAQMQHAQHRHAPKPDPPPDPHQHAHALQQQYHIQQRHFMPAGPGGFGGHGHMGRTGPRGGQQMEKLEGPVAGYSGGSH
ncbi:hypothetical protein EJ06DRAFT_94072 [Trichodelitschia bisporula]|uniref:Uncharacterized protein n=1 Tax=Trichodelitschia bisporula TaxID=703511 RepID=A0A6G1HS91_9PEZI|nr:hypothetical protein EJ06DRAFT_94072 [Trichodelitschia bisporula]